MKNVFFGLGIILILNACQSSSKNLENRYIENDLVNYNGCQLFIDDLQTEEDLKLALSFKPDILTRSWYRWGEPPKNKKYQNRLPVVKKLLASGVRLGGGTSLSIVSEHDLFDSNFKREWLSVGLDGKIRRSKSGMYLGTISSPGFRHYLINKLVKQVMIGVVELHLGETNGDIYFDKWTIKKFSSWILNKYPNQPINWWERKFGKLGAKLHNGQDLTIGEIAKLDRINKKNFFYEWGNPGNWKGLNKAGKKTFLYHLYINNLDTFIGELREALRDNKLSASIDVFGFADWITDLTNMPDAVISTPPDERWGLNWSTDPHFNFSKNRNRILNILSKENVKLGSVPIVLMIDHPFPFSNMIQLPDQKQMLIHKFFSQVAHQIGAKYVVRSYKDNLKNLGPLTSKWLKNYCSKQKKGL